MVSQKTFKEFVEICETLELDEIAAVPAGKKLRYKGGQPLPPEDRESLQQISNMNRGIYHKSNQQKSEPESKTSPSVKRRGRRIQFDDRSNASSQGRRGRGGSRFSEEVELDEVLMVTPPKTATKSKTKPSSSSNRPDPSDPNYVEKYRKYIKAKNQQREEVENFDEGIGTSIVNSPLFTKAPVASRRGEIRKKYLLRKTLEYAKKAQKKPVSGRAADPNIPRRGRRVKNSGDQNA